MQGNHQASGGCKDKIRCTGTKVFEDMRMRGYKQYVTCRLKIQKNMF